MTIPRYLFIVGCGRSGTTLVYENLLQSVEAYHFTNLEDRFPCLRLISQLAHSDLARRSGRVIPSEGYGVWNALLPEALDEDAGEEYKAALSNEEMKSRIRGYVGERLGLHGHTLFVNKNTRNSTRLDLLAEVFPDARFVHVVRHPLAVVNSLLKVNFWKTMNVWFEGGRTVSQIATTRQEEVELAGRIWVRETESVHRALDRLPTSRWIRIAYEDYVQSPRTYLQQIAGLAEVDLSGEQDYGTRRGRNQQFRENMSPQDIETARRVLAGTANAFGYRLDDEQ